MGLRAGGNLHQDNGRIGCHDQAREKMNAVTLPAPAATGHAIPAYRAGLGLRDVHMQHVLDAKPEVAWFEVLIDNYLLQSNWQLARLCRIRENYPLTFHCVGMSIGGCDALDFDYLARIKQLADILQPAWISDHLCFTAVNGRHFHDLLPIPYSPESLAHVRDRILQVQEYLGQRLLVENISSYLDYRISSVSEAEFLTQVAKAADCELLLDINNIYVNCCNHNYSVDSYLEHLPTGRVREFHLGGFEDCGTYLLDSHSRPVSEQVLALYRAFVRRLPQVPTLIEWDNDIPSFAVLQQEADKAERIINQEVTYRKSVS